MTKLIVFIFPIFIYANSLFLNTEQKASPKAFNNFSELNLIYNFNKYSLYSSFSAKPFFLNHQFAYLRDFDDSINNFEYSFSFPLINYFSFAGSFSIKEEIFNYAFSSLFRNSYFYFAIDLKFNQDIKQDFFLGLIYKNISPFFHLNRYRNKLAFDTGISIINFYGFDISYTFSKLEKDIKHNFYLASNFSFLTTGISSKNKTIDKIYLNLHTKEKENYIFSNEKYSLIINLDEKLKEYKSSKINARNYSFLDLIMSIKKSINDDKIDSFIFNIENPSLSISQAEELIKILKKSQKPYYVYLRNSTLGDYLLAANSNIISINPASTLDISGSNISNIFLGKLFKILGIEANFFKQGNYKTAPEMFTKEKASRYSIQELDKLTKSIKKNIKIMLSQKRKFLNLEEILNNAPYSPIDSKKLMLVDNIEHLNSFLNSILNSRNTILIKPSSYFSEKYQNMIYKNKKQVAVIVFDGIIMQNKSILGGNYRKNILNSIKEITFNDNIKSVIIRINSPGGDALLSEEIYNQLLILKQIKPIFVSISSVGASGGYYISLASDKIYANKTSIVGSIGVYSGKFVIKELLKKLNISSYVKNFWNNSNIYSPFSTLTKKQKEKMQKLIDSFYSLFLKRVSDSRKIKIEKIKMLAQGKIYSGEETKNNKLIDKNYSFSEVLDLSGFNSKDYELIAYPQNNNFIKKILGLEKKLEYSIKTFLNILSTNILFISFYGFFN